MKPNTEMRVLSAGVGTGKSAIMQVRKFTSNAQFTTMVSLMCGEEGEWYREKFLEMAARINTMPKTYEQDGKGEDAIAYLHYFYGNADWYIIEKDAEDEQHQAFGYADLGYGGEMGYISIEELIENGVELDLHFEPKTMGEIIKAMETN
jgi:hypothetical protein